jgi:hypothetical protein
MFSTLKALWNRLAGGRDGPQPEEAPAEAVEYKGYRIRPAPYPAKGQYQTAGVIEKDTADGVKEHRFVRADTHASKDDATAFSISKGKQIVDQQGDRMFGSE